MKLRSFMSMALLSICLVVGTCTTNAFAAVQFDQAAIEAETAAAVGAGVDPAIAAKMAIVNAVKAVVAANPDYPGGQEALIADIQTALAALEIPGMEIADVVGAGNYALGLSTDPALEAYEGSGRGQNNPGQRGRERARTQGGHAYGPGGKPQAGSPT